MGYSSNGPVLKKRKLKKKGEEKKEKEKAEKHPMTYKEYPLQDASPSPGCNDGLHRFRVFLVFLHNIYNNTGPENRLAGRSFNSFLGIPGKITGIARNPEPKRRKMQRRTQTLGCP